jgi:Flp pilus assembly protein TadG
MSRRPVHRPDLVRDESGVIVNFLIKTLVVFALLGLVAYDLGQVVVAQVKAQDTATAAAQAAADTYFMTKNYQRARNAADQAAASQDPGSRITAFAINSDGSVSVTVMRTANTLIVARVPPLRRFGMQQATDQESHAS